MPKKQVDNCLKYDTIVMEHFMKKTMILIYFSVFLLTISWCYDINDIQSIEIYARAGGWGGLRRGEINTLIIDRIDDGFFMKNIDNSSNPSLKNSIIKLLQIIDTPVIDNIDLDNFGITNEWLSFYSNSMVNINQRWAENQKELFKYNYCNSALVLELLQKQYVPNRIHWTDDYPSFELVINFTESKLTIRSDSQLPFMLPIRIFGNENINTYNADLSKAISNILPDNFILKSRIAGEGLPKYLFEQINIFIRDELSMLNTRNRIGDTLLDIENQFHIKTSAIRTMSSIDLDLETVWDVELIHKNGPDNLVVNLSISYKDEILGGMNHFYKKINDILELVLSIPWLNNLLKNNENEIEIRFLNNKSMSNKAQNSFINDLQNNNKNDLLGIISNELDNSIFITISNNRSYMRCIVLPNCETILWHYRGNDILLWDDENFETWDYYGHRGVGKIISLNGEIEN